MAAELGVNAGVAKRGGLLHDVGKAVDREMEGTHLELGRELLRKFGEPEEVIHAMECHHGDVEPALRRGGAGHRRRRAVGGPPRRPPRDPRELHQAAREARGDRRADFKGVQKAFAIQAGPRAAHHRRGASEGHRRGGATGCRSDIAQADRGGAHLPRPDQGDGDPRDARRRVREVGSGTGLNLLFIGDVIGNPGRRALTEALPGVIDRKKVDFTVVERRERRRGLRRDDGRLSRSSKLPIDVFTSGNHIWDKKEFVPHLDEIPNILRPANYPPGNPGKGWVVRETPAGIPVGVVNLMGQVYMPNVDSPFRKIDEILVSGVLPKIVFVDMHAEVTSEKNAMGHWLDGRVSAVAGTHTHIPTADERILPGGTGYLTDVGGTGAYDGIIGFKKERILEKFLSQTPRSYEVATKDIRLSCVLFTIDEESAKTVAVERFQVRVD